jgi:hypothetical protein
MPHFHHSVAAMVSVIALAAVPAIAADPASETQLERLMEAAAQTPDRPDHDYRRGTGGRGGLPLRRSSDHRRGTQGRA